MHRRRYERVVAGKGRAVGTKLLPGGVAGVAARPAWTLTDGVLARGELFGADGDRLERAVAGEADTDGRLALPHGVLRAPARRARPAAALVNAVVAHMRTAPPGTSVVGRSPAPYEAQAAG